jgi:polyhydroxybutyrate depolymerase
MKLRAAATRTALALLVAAPLGASLAACRDKPTLTVPVGQSTHVLTVGGKAREYRLFRPDALPARASLVIMLHGGFGTAEQAEKAYGWDELAQREHFLVAYPNGVDRAWNGGGGCCGNPGRDGVDDVAFITAVVAQLQGLVPIDAARVYATGMSNGGIMSYRLACDSKVFAAIAPVAGTVLGSCDSPPAVSVLHIHGLADKNVPFDGSRGEGVGHIDGPPMPEIIAAFRAAANCAAPTESKVDAVTTSIAGCPGGRTVELITIDGAGHQWPGSRRNAVSGLVPGIDTPSPALDATEVIWQFFASHPAPTT